MCTSSTHKERRPVKLFTDNSVKTIVYGNNEINNVSRCRLCAPLAPIKKGRPVKLFTDNSVKTIVYGNNEVNNVSRCRLAPMGGVYIEGDNMDIDQ